MNTTLAAAWFGMVLRMSFIQAGDTTIKIGHRKRIRNIVMSETRELLEVDQCRVTLMVSYADCAGCAEYWGV